MSGRTAMEAAPGGSAAPLRILSVTTLFPSPVQPLHGLFVERRLRAVAKRCRVDVIAPVHVGRHPRGLWTRLSVPRRDGLAVRHPRFALPPRWGKAWDGRLLAAQIEPQIRAALSPEGYDLVDAHYAYPDGEAALRIARHMDLPLSLSVRGSDLHVLARDPGRKPRIQAVLRGAAAVIAVSRPLAEEAERLGADPGRVHVIPNGVDTDRFHPRDRLEARLALGIPRDERVLLAVGRLHPVKGYELLIRALAEVDERRWGRVTCRIAGEGPLEGRLRSLAARLGVEDRVRLLGSVAPEELPLHYAAADATCLPSESEGSPNVVLESLASGTPVLATPVGDLREILEDGRAGVLAPSREPRAVAQAIGRILERSWDPRAVASSPAVRSWDDVASEQIAVYRAIGVSCRP